MSSAARPGARCRLIRVGDGAASGDQRFWRDAVEYCSWLARETGLPFRLPSEAEWEKGARGTTEWKFPWGNDPVTPERANYWEAGLKRTVAVGTLPGGASPYGLQDMIGNVWEWCRDKHGNFYYRESPTIDPPGPAAGSRGVRARRLLLHPESQLAQHQPPGLSPGSLPSYHRFSSLPAGVIFEHEPC